MFCALGLKVRERRDPEERDEDDDGEEEKAMELNSQAFHFVQPTVEGIEEGMNFREINM